MRFSISHSTCTAEDPRKIRGRPPRKTWIQKHTGPPASKFWRKATAEDTAEVIWRHRLHFELWGLSSSTVGFRWLHWAAGYRVATGWQATGWPPIQKSTEFRLHRGRSVEDARKIRGRPPRKSDSSD